MKKKKINSWRLIAEKVIKSPGLIFFSAFIAYCILLISAGIHGIRHLLVFIPLACLVSANGFWKLSQLSRYPSVITGIILSLLVTYQCYTVINLNRMYSDDIRNKMVEWVAKNVRNGNKVGTFSTYSWIKGVQFIPNKEVNESKLSLDYFVTCDLEYNRYFENNDAANIFHAFGGQQRLNFYRDLFSGKLQYEVVADFRRQPFGLEQYLVEKGVIKDLQTFTPKRCFVFKHITSNIEKFDIRDRKQNGLSEQSKSVFLMENR